MLLAGVPHAGRDVLVLMALQFTLLVLFGFLGSYEDKADTKIYPMFQDVHVMIFIGFGFLMTFLKRYGFSSVGFNLLVAAFIIQWAIICRGLPYMKNYKIPIGLESLLEADVAAAVVLISMGAVLGRTSYMQLIAMGVIEIAFFVGNAWIGHELFLANDAGDSIFVHAFGAYFGLAVSFVLEKFRKERSKETEEEEQELEGSSYNSDLFAMIGTIFLWMFWPSFNSAAQTGLMQERAIINTYLALASCCVVAYFMSTALSHDNKFDMVHIQNSTLAGGVAVGTSANLLLQPYGAIIVGILAGALSVFGYSILTPWIDKRLKIHDTCGVHNLHGMPAILAAIVGAFMSKIAYYEDYGEDLFEIFPARSQGNSTDTLLSIKLNNRSANEQAGYQIAAIVVTLVIAIITGLLTGLVISAPCTTRIPVGKAYSDDPIWIIHEPHEETAAD